MNTLKLFTPLDGVLTILLFTWLYNSKTNDQRRMSAEGKEKRSVCEKEVLSWKSQELVKIVQKSFFLPLHNLICWLPIVPTLVIFAVRSLNFKWFQLGIEVRIRNCRFGKKREKKNIYSYLFFAIINFIKHHGKAYWIRTARKGTSSGTENLYY